MIRRTYEFTGIIQGVGFRPCIARLAQARSISGWIQNRSGSVCAQFTAAPEEIDGLLKELRSHPPSLSHIDSVELISEETAQDPEGGFHILEGTSEDSRNIMIPADVAMCPDCEKELGDPSDRRFRYPFTTCVNCGPRYTVIVDMPYERVNTTMKSFPLCPNCELEYTNPADRRFHAETTCCPKCGPTLTLLHMPEVREKETGSSSQERPTQKDLSEQAPSESGGTGSTPSGLRGRRPSQTRTPARIAEGNKALQLSRQALAEGKIVAVKGIGGFLLAADPQNADTVTRLRALKGRPDKPFALMASSINVVRRYFTISEAEAELLQSPQAPIVIIKTSACRATPFDLSVIAPDTDTVGIMLPTSPLHSVLFTPGPNDSIPAFDFLIMTSGNRRSEPICLTADDALSRLTGIADVVLTHDRAINLRNDDSLCIVNNSGPQVWRRARGFSPSPLALPSECSVNILGMGAEIKNCLTMAYGREAVVSPHIGDLETPEAIEHMALVSEKLPTFLGKTVEAVAVDMNPDMHSSAAGRQIAQTLAVPCIEVQHHEAHAVACLAENGLTSGLALTFDGTGLGKDGTVWGAELFHVDDGICTRLATYRPAPLPGGDRAVTQPVRQLIARLLQANSPISSEMLALLGVTPEQCSVWKKQCEESLNCPVSSGAGRLFDSVSSLLGIAPHEITYEGQPAIRLEAEASRFTGKPSKDIPFGIAEENQMLVIDWAPFFDCVSDIKTMRAEAGDYALSFHMAVLKSASAMLEYGMSRCNEKHVAVSGGVFMNQILHAGICESIDALGLKPATQSYLPPNDGCISFGQVVQANRLLRSE